MEINEENAVKIKIEIQSLNGKDLNLKYENIIPLGVATHILNRVKKWKKEVWTTIETIEKFQESEKQFQKKK